MQWPRKTPIPPPVWPSDLGDRSALQRWVPPPDCADDLQQAIKALHALCLESANALSAPTRGVFGSLSGLDFELAAALESSELARAASAGDVEAVESLIAAHRGAARGDIDGAAGAAQLALIGELSAALAAAAVCGRSETAERLLEAGAMPNAGEGRALALALHGASYAHSGGRADENAIVIEPTRKPANYEPRRNRIGDFRRVIELLVRWGACPLYRDGLCFALLAAMQRSERYHQDVEELLGIVTRGVANCADFCGGARARGSRTARTLSLKA